MGLGRAPLASTGLQGRLIRRVPAWIALAVLLVVGLNYSLWWPGWAHNNPAAWAAPADLWGTYLASANLVHGHFDQIYIARTGLETFPGVLVLMAPMTALGSAMHLELGPNLAAFSKPTGWVLAGPYMLVLSSVVLFAADALAERLAVPRGRRVALALVEAALLFNVTIRWGHPEDAVALGLVLYAALDADRGRWTRAAWLIGVAICVQPFALIALPALFARLDWRRIGRLVLPVVVPSVVVLAGPLIASWHATVHILVDQPNYPNFNHPTPWTSLLTPLRQQFVAVPSGPGRIIAIALAFVVGIAVCRRRYRLEVVVAVIGLGILFRLLGESVLDSFYSWPLLAVGVLLAARRGPWRLAAVSTVALFATWFSNVQWRGVWPWWSVLMLILAAVLALGWPERSSFAPVVPGADRAPGSVAGSADDETPAPTPTTGAGATTGIVDQ